MHLTVDVHHYFKNALPPSQPDPQVAENLTQLLAILQHLSKQVALMSQSLHDQLTSGLGDLRVQVTRLRRVEEGFILVQTTQAAQLAAVISNLAASGISQDQLAEVSALHTLLADTATQMETAAALVANTSAAPTTGTTLPVASGPGDTGSTTGTTEPATGTAPTPSLPTDAPPPPAQPSDAPSA